MSAPDKEGSPPRVSSRWWLAFLGLALVEAAGLVAIRARVPELSEWRDAAAFVREQHRPEDAIIAAPGWADPLLRWVLGDRIPFRVAGRTDLAPFQRLWVVSIRGARSPEAPDEDPALERSFGRVRVQRWDLPPSPVLFDFVERVREARVSLVERGVEQPCPWMTGAPRGGGLGQGAMWPGERFQCDPRRAWLFVGATVQDDLEIQPRWCVWQHPAGEEPVRASWSDVPLGRSLVLHGGIYYEHERMREHGPVRLRVLVDGVEVGSMTHRDGDGWKALVADTRSGGATAERGVVTVEVTAPNPHLRTFCWAATTRGTPP